MREMKDSGVEWIGEIPEDWNVGKTLYALSMPITDGPHETPELFDEGIPFISAEAVSCGNGHCTGQAVPGGHWLPDSGWPCPPIPAARFRRTSGCSSLLCSPYGFSICRTQAGCAPRSCQGRTLYGSWGAICLFRPSPAW